MKIYYLLIVVPVLASFSCDKIKNITNKASSALDGKGSKSSADPELMKLVDQTPEGVIFRKDLPFPKSISVTVTRKLVMSGQYSEKSEISRQTNAVRGTSTNIIKLERTNDKVAYSLIKSKFEKPLTKEEEAKSKAPEITETAPASKEPDVYVKSGSAWKPANTTDFRIAAIAQSICPVFDELLVDTGLAPRTQWFGKHRIKIGDSLTIKGNNLKMIFEGSITGTLKLTLESISEVNGHPCGVFAISGNYANKNFADFQGGFSSEEVTIESGKIWLSLLHPLVLRTETDNISTMRTGSKGGLVTGIQGSVISSRTLDWKITGQ